MKAKYVVLLTTVYIFCALSFGHSCYAQTDEVMKRPAWIGLHYSLENTYLDDISVPGRYEELGSLEEKAREIAIERRLGAVGNDKAWVKTNPINTYYSKKEGAAHFLIQTGENPNKSHKTWEKVQITDKYSFSARVFVPGMAQMYKGSYGKGAVFITGEVLLVGGAITMEFMRRNYSIKINQSHKAEIRKHYAHNANICAISRNVCIGGAVALYIWNIVDGAVAKGRPYLVVNDDILLVFSPYVSSDATGIAMNLKF